MKKKLSSTSGFSLIEVLVVVAAISAVTSLGYVTVVSVQDTARETKLRADVESINSSVQAYLVSGGKIPQDATLDNVMTKLKTRSTMSAAQGTMGMSGSFLDPKVVAEYQSGSSKLKAFWDPAASRLYTAKSANLGVLSFALDESKAAVAPSTENRLSGQALVASDMSSGGPKWVWEYEDSDPESVWTGNSGASMATPGQLAALSQGFQSGYYSVDSPDGTVSVNYVFREAGYSSRLGLFSLEGMGADVYDLNTAEGAKAFLEEAIRRVINADNSNQGQVIVDASKSSIGFGKQYQFTPGDTLAAILIPNASFETALNALVNNSTTSQTYPLLSLSLPVNQAPFYLKQIASLGNSGYAIEDIPGTSSDYDYNDLIFKATGLQVPDSSSGTVIDPQTYYQNQPYWDEPGPNGMSIKDALTQAGIIP